MKKQHSFLRKFVVHFRLEKFIGLSVEIVITSLEDLAWDKAP